MITISKIGVRGFSTDCKIQSHMQRGCRKSYNAAYTQQHRCKSGASFNPIDLKFDNYDTQTSTKNLVILHGLLGSKQNWRALGKAFSQKLNSSVFTLDLRNHGDSAHSAKMSYRDMASDVEHFIKRHNLDNDNKELILMGHSMGGRVAMEVALTNEVPLDKLILVDISPLKMDIKSSFEKYLLAMKEVESAKLTKQSQADEILKKSVSDIGVRQFLLTNYKKNPSTAIYNFRNPLDVITEHLDEIGHLAINSRTFSKPTLFIRGTKSHYLDPSTYAQIKAIFLQSEFEDIEAGHWVHSENPNAFIRACLNYLN